MIDNYVQEMLGNTGTGTYCNVVFLCTLSWSLYCTGTVPVRYIANKISSVACGGGEDSRISNDMLYHWAKYRSWFIVYGPLL